MMRSIWPSPKHSFQSAIWCTSERFPAVRFAVREITLAGRLELLRSLRDLIGRHEFLNAGNKGEKTEAAIAELQACQLYLEWGLAAIEGLTIDGRPASVDDVFTLAPESLCREIVDVIRGRLELTEEERKNS